MQNPLRVVITGAAGLTGGAIACRWAALGLGRLGEAHITALLDQSDSSAAARLRDSGVHTLPADLSAPESYAAALQGAGLVVHAAAEARSAHPERIWRTAVDATRALYQAAASAGVRRFIYISALGISGRSDGRLTEEAAPQPTGDLFHDAHLAAELALHELAAAPGAPALVILRFPAIYGPGAERWTQRPLRQALQGRLSVPGHGDFPFAYLYVDNMVDAVTRAAVSDAQGVYNIFDGVHPFADFMRHYSLMAGTRLRSRALLTLRALATMREWLGWLVGRYPRFNRSALEHLLEPFDADSRPEKAMQVLSWQPRVSLAEGMAAIERHNGFHKAPKPPDPWMENKEFGAKN